MDGPAEATFEAALARRDWRVATDEASLIAAHPDVFLRDRWVASVRVLGSLAGGDLVGAAAWQDSTPLPDVRVSRALVDELERAGEHELAAHAAWSLSVIEGDFDVESDDGLADDFFERTSSRFADHWLGWLSRWPNDVTALVQALSHLVLAERKAEAHRLAETALARPPVDHTVAVAGIRALMAAGVVDRASAVAMSLATAEAFTAVAEGLSEVDVAGATAWFERALAVEPDDTATLNAFAWHLREAGDDARADLLEARAVELDDDDDV